MNEKILLCDVDSIIPNLAIMKLSTYYKNSGDSVSLIRGTNVASKLDGWTEPIDHVFISCVFSANEEAARQMIAQFDCDDVRLGGSGVDLKTVLPDEIENLMPDYSIYHGIYPESKYTSYGFTARGCLRKCPFCIVHDKEGKIHPVGDIYSFWDKEAGHTHLFILDNNPFALPDHFKLIASQIIKEGLQVNFQSGFDIRLLTDEFAQILKKLHIHEPTFAWDNTKIEDDVILGIDMLKRNKINRSNFYVLAGFDTPFEDALYRVNRLKEMGQRAYVMAYDKDNLFKRDVRYYHLRNWANARMIFMTNTFEEFMESKEGKKSIKNAHRLDEYLI